LENGPSSNYAAYFDVDWEPQEKSLHNRVLMPILGDHYGRVIAAGDIRVERLGGSFHFRYHDHLLPIAPPTLDEILSEAADRAKSDLLAFTADIARHLPSAERVDRRSVARRHRDKEILRRMLDQELLEHPEWADAVDGVLKEINQSADRIDELLERQNYRLAFWRVASQDIDYRRFFDINTLVGLRMEDERVFEDTHALVLHWLNRGVIDGLRIDHPDGLRDPQRYFERLAQAAPRAWIVAEKILMPDEQLPQSWPIAGTTGYDFANLATRLFIDPDGEVILTEFYAEFSGESTDYQALAREKKHQVMRELFASDINRLTAQLAEVCQRRRHYRDYTRREMNQMLREVIACLSVYRTYAQAEDGRLEESDAKRIDEAVEAAKTNRPDLDGELFDFFRSILFLKTRGPAETELVMRFQQCTGPVMAKGIEDTLFYCYNRFIALNDVGGEGSWFSISPEEFYRRNAERLVRYPQTMLASTTHDTKRSEDVRARLAVLSEIPKRWSGAVREWAANNQQYKSQFQPDRNLEYLYYQTLIGAWPIDVDRVWEVMLKSAREAKQHTSWRSPDEGYETALREFIELTMADEKFITSVSKFIEPIITSGRINSLSQTLLKLTVPGVPDIYQGSELWDLRLVDPDNRRPVDFAARRKLLNEIEGLTPDAMLDRSDEGSPKLWLIRQTLRVRGEFYETFARGEYKALQAVGDRADHVVGFMRGDKVISIVPRLLVRLVDGWLDTSLNLPAGKWRNSLTGDTISGGRQKISDLLKRFPVALLVKD
jgi:(1->4)-alpha-D-glucan 1-alpha-D-glucosylmutase